MAGDVQSLSSALASSSAKATARDDVMLAYADKEADRKAITSAKMNDIKGQLDNLGSAFKISSAGQQAMQSAVS
jgi:hypothetical protein